MRTVTRVRLMGFGIWLMTVAAGLLMCRAARAESGVSWTTGTFEASPAGTDLANTLDNRIRELKTTIREYAETDLCWSSNDTDGCSGTSGGDGRLREGGCRVFADDAQPAAMNAADFAGSTSLDQGRLWVDTNDSNHLRMYDSSWEEVDGVPAADRTAWNAAVTQQTENLLAVKVTTNAVRDLGGTDCAAPVAVIWNTEDFDDSSMHDAATSDTTRKQLVTPAGATRVRLYAYIRTNSIGGPQNNSIPLGIRKDGTTFVAVQRMNNNSNVVDPAVTISTGPLTVTGGSTYFEVMVDAAVGCKMTDGDGDQVQTDSYFSMEVIQ